MKFKIQIIISVFFLQLLQPCHAFSQTGYSSEMESKSDSTICNYSNGSIVCHGFSVCRDSTGYVELHSCVPTKGRYSGDNVQGPVNGEYIFLPWTVGNNLILYQIDSIGTCSFIINVKNPTIPKIGAITAIHDQTCIGDTVRCSIPPLSNVNSYTWAFSGDTVVNNLNNYEFVAKNYHHSSFLTVFGKNDCRNGDTASIFININQPPITPIYGKDTLCHNTYWASYYGIIDSRPYRWVWSADTGDFQSWPDTNQVLVHWKNKNNSGKINLLRMHRNNNNCFSKSELTIFFENNYAPDTVYVMAKNNDPESKMLIAPENFVHYKWGYERKTDRIEHTESGCTDQHYCEYTVLDTTEYFYWVKISNDNSCETKSYFSSKFLFTNDISPENIIVYPNPFMDHLVINFEKFNHIFKKISILSILGFALYEDNLISSKTQTSFVNTSSLPTGLYLLILEDAQGKRYTRKIIKN